MPQILPTPRTDEAFQLKHQSFLDIGRTQAPRVVFLGDSLTRRWEDNPELWNRFFGDFSPANFGIGGDGIDQVLWRLDQGELSGLDPRIVVLLIGTNNLSRNTDSEIVAGIRTVLDRLGHIVPDAEVLLLGLLPRDVDERNRNCSSRILGINRELSALERNGAVVFADLGEPFRDETGALRLDLMPDGLHLNEDGYEVFGPLLRATILERMEAATRS